MLRGDDRVDSGHCTVAGATQPQPIGVWTRHHPISTSTAAPHVQHLISRITSNWSTVRRSEYFAPHFRHRIYSNSCWICPPSSKADLTGANVDLLATSISCESLTRPARRHLLRRANGPVLTISGLAHGNGGTAGGLSLARLQGPADARIGCACGSICEGWPGRAIVRVSIVASDDPARRQKWPDMAPLLFVCDAVTCICSKTPDWDAYTRPSSPSIGTRTGPVHSAQLARVTVPGGCFLRFRHRRTIRQARPAMEHEDPTPSASSR